MSLSMIIGVLSCVLLVLKLVQTYTKLMKKARGEEVDI